jgi:hypothetical protein
MGSADSNPSTPGRLTRPRLLTLFVGKAKDPLAPDVFHKVSLAWISTGENSSNR